MSPPRVGVIGARRRRQGLGPFVVRELCAAGAAVPCFLATSEATRDATRRELLDRGVDARGYLALDAMLGEEALDGLAILSPAETHERFLAAAPPAGLHALCEKPLLWGRPGLAGTAEELLARFDAGGLVVVENCPWPYTLDAYERLHPGRLGRAPRRFEMRLQPAGLGVEMLGDSMPHALSLLQAVAPGGGAAAGIRFEGRLDRGPMTVSFRYPTPAGHTDVRVDLAPTAAHPREASFSLDGRSAERRVAPETYELSFACGDREVPVPDPLGRLVADFVQDLRAARPASRSAATLQRARLLDQLVDAYARARGRAGGACAGGA